MTPIYLPPVCWLLDPPAPLELGVDVAWDPESNTVRRIAGGAVPDGGTIIVQQQAGVQAALIAALDAGQTIALPLPALRVQAVTDWDTEDPQGTDWSDWCWAAGGSQTLSSQPQPAWISGPEVLADAWRALADDDVLVRIAVALTPELLLPIFEGFVTQLAATADSAGRVGVRLELADPLLRLQPPYAALESRRWGRSVIRERQVIQTTTDAGFQVAQIIETLRPGPYPTAHAVCRAIFAALGDPWFTRLSLGFLDFPLVELDGRDRTPLELLQEIARLAGAQMRAAGRLLLMQEAGPASRLAGAPGRLTFRHPRAAIAGVERGTHVEAAPSAVQLFGHTASDAAPGSPQGTPAVAGLERIGETRGTLRPQEPVRTDQPPAPVLITFTFNASLFDPRTLVVEGARRIGPPQYWQEGSITWARIELELPWVVTDLTGDPPFTLDEAGDPRFRLIGQIVDALASSEGAPVPVPFAQVTRTRLVGDEPMDDEETVLADAEGYYVFTDVPLARWRITAQATGYRDNWSDTDPTNNLVRDLPEEYAAWLEGSAGGRYRKEPTPYHITVWAKRYGSASGVQDLTVGQVRVEVRAQEVPLPQLRYAPARRDERLTTQRLAIRAGQVLLWALRQAERGLTAAIPANPLLLPGDRLRLDLPEGTVHFDAGRIAWTVDAQEGSAQWRVGPVDASLARSLVPAIADDPLETRVGVVVALPRNAFGQTVADVEIEGQVVPGLGISPMPGMLTVGEAVQVAKWFPGASTRLVVARAPLVFGELRMAIVPVE